MKNEKFNSINVNLMLPSYIDCDLEKVRILNENKDKAGVYCWINNINDKLYVGSSTNLRTRFYKYYSIKNLSEKRTPIHNALLKYGYSNFSLVILEYINGNENPIKKEQYYLDLLKPEYNILETAGSSLGYKHSDETLKYFREKRIITDETRENLSIAARERILPQEVRDKISEKRKGIKLSEATRAKISESAIILRGVKVNITNVETNEILSFDNLTAAAKHAGVSRPAIAKALKNGSLVKGIFKIN